MGLRLPIFTLTFGTDDRNIHSGTIKLFQLNNFVFPQVYEYFRGGALVRKPQ